MNSSEKPRANANGRSPLTLFPPSRRDALPRRRRRLGGVHRLQCLLGGGRELSMNVNPPERVLSAQRVRMTAPSLGAQREVDARRLLPDVVRDPFRGTVVPVPLPKLMRGSIVKGIKTVQGRPAGVLLATLRAQESRPSRVAAVPAASGSLCHGRPSVGTRETGAVSAEAVAETLSIGTGPNPVLIGLPGTKGRKEDRSKNSRRGSAASVRSPRDWP